jgi:hypothetical protein
VLDTATLVQSAVPATVLAVVLIAKIAPVTPEGVVV